jgi:hypothetical protein
MSVVVDEQIKPWTARRKSALVLEHQPGYSSKWAATGAAAKIGCVSRAQAPPLRTAP